MTFTVDWACISNMCLDLVLTNSPLCSLLLILSLLSSAHPLLPEGLAHASASVRTVPELILFSPGMVPATTVAG